MDVVGPQSILRLLKVIASHHAHIAHVDGLQGHGLVSVGEFPVEGVFVLDPLGSLLLWGFVHVGKIRGDKKWWLLKNN